MASTSASTLIIFIAAVSIAAGVSGALVDTVGGIADSIDEQGVDVANQIDTDVEIISDPGSDAVYKETDDEVWLLVKNTGRRTIATDDTSVEVLIDGQYVSRSDYTVTVLDGSDWKDGHVVRIVVDRTLSAGDHRATVIVETERETLRFRT